MKDIQIHINVNNDTYLKNPNSTDLGKVIISNSINLIDDLGFEAFTFKKLSARIGSPESSIYRYFDSKHMLLIYLTSWYWSWIEYNLVFSISNIISPKKKLQTAIKILTTPVEVDSSISHINEILLDRIVMNESIKTYHIKAVDEENKKGYFTEYKRVVQRVSNIVLEINSSFKYPHMLVSTFIEGAHQQRYFAEHLPSLTDNKEGKHSILNFYTQLVFSVIAS